MPNFLNKNMCVHTCVFIDVATVWEETHQKMNTIYHGSQVTLIFLMSAVFGFSSSLRDIMIPVIREKNKNLKNQSLSTLMLYHFSCPSLSRGKINLRKTKELAHDPTTYKFSENRNYICLFIVTSLLSITMPDSR